MSRNSTSFGPGNQAARKHGLRSEASHREAVEKLRGKYRDDLLSMNPDLSTVELDLGIDILADLASIRAYIARRGGILMLTGQVRKCALERDRLMGRYEAWAKRNDPAATGPRDTLPQRLATEKRERAAAAQAELSRLYGPDARGD